MPGLASAYYPAELTSLSMHTVIDASMCVSYLLLLPNVMLKARHQVLSDGLNTLVVAGESTCPPFAHAVERSSNPLLSVSSSWP
jgi:hypothetical protein